MATIKFGTDGWRAIIADEFTLENIARVADATAQWLLKANNEPKVVIGYDTRFGGQLFAETAAMILCDQGIKVYLSKSFVSTPMVSLGTVHYKASLGIILTASHNPPSYNGYKLKGSYGGPLMPEHVQEVEDIIPESGRYADFKRSMLESRSVRAAEYLIEPTPEATLTNLLPLLFKMHIYNIILEANASEHSARRLAMKNASDNAGELSSTLALEYNRTRQAAITKEIIEITSTAAAMK